MGITLFRRRHAADEEGPTERPDVRQYRFLLRTADLEVLDLLHRDSLAALDVLIRAHILRTAQDRLLSGRELTVDDIAGLAHLLSVGESRTPGILLSALTDAAVERLAHVVITRPEAASLLEGYATWDGLDMQSAPGVAGVTPHVARHATTPASPTASQGTPQTAAQGA